MVIALNRSTQILIDNFIDKHFSGSDKVAVKQEALEIADTILEQNNANLKDNLNKLIAKGDLRDEIMPIKDEIKVLKDDVATLKNDMAAVKGDIITIKSNIATIQTAIQDNFKKEITESKYDILRWLVMTQIAMVGILIATKLI